ncbi:MAG: response regulator [Elusimicrobia bacterium]|nr:response regulator [Elusimicrobiota bacterium]
MSEELEDPKTKLVLIVDDDAGLVDMLSTWVKSEGFQVETAASGDQALRKIDARTPDLILLDYMLPGTGGYEVAKELQSGDARAVPVFLITGRRLDRAQTEMLRRESNVKEYIEKPVKPAVLASLIHRTLRTRPPVIARKQDRGPLSSGW